MGLATNGPLMVQIPVPTFFLCPISLDLMRDPVTLISGQTYDRISIQKWIDDGHCTCPVTRIPINTELEEPIPNHALRRMIQAWCVQNKSSGIERIHTPRQPPSLKDIPHLLEQIQTRHTAPGDGMHLCADGLQKLCVLASDRPKARLLLLRAGAPHILSLCLSKSLPLCRKTVPSVEVEDALHLLASLAEEAKAGPRTSFSWEPTCADNVSALAEIIVDARTKIALRRDAAVVLSNAAELFDCMKREVGAIQGFMSRVVGLIREAPAASMVSLQHRCTSSSLDYFGIAGLGLLLAICKTSTKNRHLAVEAGALNALTSLLSSLCPDAKTCPDTALTRIIEPGLKVWETLCKCADGRAATWQSMGLLMRLTCNVSHKATKYSIRILWLLLMFAPVGAPVAKQAVKHGAFLKAMAVAQGDASLKTRSLAGKIAKELSRFVIASHSHLNFE